MERGSNEGVDNLTLVLSGKGSQLECVLNPPIYVSGDYEMCMLSLQTYNSIPNVSSRNNVFRYYRMTANKSEEWRNIIIPEGTYDIEDIEKYINVELRADADDRDAVVITGNSNTMKVHLKSTVDVDFSVENSIGSLLGFGRTKVQGHISVNSEDIVDINKISAIDVMCNIVDGSYINGEASHILYHFYPNVPPGFKIIEVPQEKIYMPVNANVLSSIVIRAVDQSGRLIDLRGEELTIYLRIRRR